MFCGKCGNQIENNVPFCPQCGSPTGVGASENVKAAGSAASQTSSASSPSASPAPLAQAASSIDTAKLKAMWQPLAAAAVMLFALFQNWLKFDLDLYYYDINETFSLGDLKSLAKMLKGYLADFGYSSSELSNVTLFINVIFIASWILIIVEIAFIITKLINESHYEILGKFGGYLGIDLSAVVIFVAYIIISRLGEMFDTDMSLLDIPLTIYPLVTLAVSVWQLLVVNHGRSWTYASSGNSYKPSYTPAPVPKPTAAVTCKACGTINRVTDSRCASCGEKLANKVCKYCGALNFPTDSRCCKCDAPLNENEVSSSYINEESEGVDTCPYCGKPVKRNGKFCASCGKSL